MDNLIFKTELIKGATGAKGDIGISDEVPVGGIIAYDGEEIPAGYEEAVEQEVFADIYSDIDDLSERIDEIEALTDASTTYDEELIDIREGYDGTEYDTAGEAVRTQVENAYSYVDEKNAEQDGAIYAGLMRATSQGTFTDGGNDAPLLKCEVTVPPSQNGTPSSAHPRPPIGLAQLSVNVNGTTHTAKVGQKNLLKISLDYIKENNNLVWTQVTGGWKGAFDGTDDYFLITTDENDLVTKITIHKEDSSVGRSIKLGTIDPGYYRGLKLSGFPNNVSSANMLFIGDTHAYYENNDSVEVHISAGEGIEFTSFSSWAGEAEFSFMLRTSSSASGFEPYDPSVPAGLFYGGTFDFVSGALNKYPYYNSYNRENLIGHWLSSKEVYEEGESPSYYAEVVNDGAGAIISEQLSPMIIKSTLGNNVITSDYPLEVEYSRDATTVINDLLNRVSALEGE